MDDAGVRQQAQTERLAPFVVETQDDVITKLDGAVGGTPLEEELQDITLLIVFHLDDLSLVSDNLVLVDD